MRDMIRDPFEIISLVSQSMTLHRGDLIMLGTPPGVGELHPGDEVEVEIDGVGYLRNPVSAEGSERRAAVSGSARSRAAGEFRGAHGRRGSRDPGSAAAPGRRLLPGDVPLAGSDSHAGRHAVALHRDPLSAHRRRSQPFPSAALRRGVVLPRRVAGRDGVPRSARHSGRRARGAAGARARRPVDGRPGGAARARR